PFAIELSEIDLKVRAGEVVGVAGVAGNGQSEIFDALSGETVSSDNGSVRFNGQDCGSLGITARRKMGGAFVAEERLGHSAVPDLSLSENLVLARHGSDADTLLGYGPLGVIRKNVVKNLTKRIVEDMDVRKSGEDPDASALSGGNLQKFIMGRELDRKPSILVVNQPTWGVDAGAAQKIRQEVIDLARSGSAVVVISQDLDEIIEISDRIAVMSDGRLSEPENADAITREEIGLKMGGLHDG
ncbi:MAG: ATP-binding cassette domain-containing protein, partial [Amylibacter sp.]